MRQGERGAPPRARRRRSRRSATRVSASSPSRPCRTSPDLVHAEVFVSVLGVAEAAAPRALRALERAHGVLQARIARELHLKRTPQLSFHYDETLDQAMRLNELMAPRSPAPADPDSE